MEKEDCFMGVAILVSNLSHDPNTKVGACIVNVEGDIIATGYNDFPKRCKTDNFSWGKTGKLWETKYGYVCHAETSALINCSGKSTLHAVLYVVEFPCHECAKVLIQAGISKVVYLKDEQMNRESVKTAKILFDSADVEYKKFSSDIEDIDIKFRSL
ncbi:MAG: cytidine deaminase [Firmicutes bacterium HGW-Firmicutes-1]|jgi:dCMP deaminase|nr:MAG: cytidine deaminase [Firmicutes bacterium HGW-Firmicutes-1]